MNKILAETVKVEKIVPGGQALATLASGKKLFLWNALPGEVISEVELTKDKSTYAEGIATKILSTAPERIVPRDECYLSTSPWQVMNYDLELSLKKELIAEVLRQQKLPPWDIHPVVTDGKDFAYRNKMEYALYYSFDDQKIHPAFRGRGSHQKIPVRQSSLERTEIWQRANELVTELNATSAEARDYQSLLLRTSQTGRVSGGLIKNHAPRPKFPELQDLILGFEYSYSPNGFFQINLPLYELALQEIKQHINTSRVLDLYSGVGTIGLSVARDRDLTLVECDKAVYHELENNCKASGTSAKPVYAKSEEALDYINPDMTVIIDPPRAGCDVKLIEKLIEVKPPCIIYLSCNPITQARDLKLLENVYEITLVKPYNFFPRTPHIENLVVLKHR